MTFFSPGGINNEIPKRTNESMRMKDASGIKDQPEGNNVEGRKTTYS